MEVDGGMGPCGKQADGSFWLGFCISGHCN